MNLTDPSPVAVVIEDDADMRSLVCTVLGQSGFVTIPANNGEDGIRAVERHQPIVTTVDVGMPGMDGFAVVRRLREFTDGYIVMVTGQDDEIDVVQGLGAGADDYVVKPFRPRELRARIETMLRRPRHGVSFESVPGSDPVQELLSATPAVEKRPEPALEPAMASAAPVASAPAASAPTDDLPPSPDQLQIRGLAVDTATRVASLDGRGLELTRSEFDLLASLMQTGRRVRSKADLALMLRGESYVTTYYVNDADKRAVEVHVANLRRKLGESATAPRWIETVRGVGYRLAAADA